jgi:hypothetical protein
MKRKLVILTFTIGLSILSNAWTLDVPSKEQNYTLAMVAALEDHNSELATMLVKGGAAVTVVMPDGMPVFVKAAFLAQTTKGTELIMQMLEVGADVNAKNADGITALMVLDRIGIKDLRAYLLTKGAKDYDRDEVINKARVTKIDAMLLDFAAHYYAVVNSANPERPIPFEKLTGEHGVLLPWPVWGVTESRGKDVFGNPFIIDPKKKPIYVYISEETLKATSEVVDRLFWRPYIR